jgi:hypothetical protein
MAACDTDALRPIFRQELRVLTPALEAWPVPGGKRGWLVKKEQLGVETAPDLASAALKVEHAADPLPRRPTMRRQRLRVCVKAPAAVAHEQVHGQRRRITLRKGSRDFAAALLCLNFAYGIVTAVVRLYLFHGRRVGSAA